MHQTTFHGLATFASVQVDDELDLSDCVFVSILGLKRVRARTLVAQRSRFLDRVTVEDLGITFVFDASDAHVEASFAIDGGSMGELNLHRCRFEADVTIRNLHVAARLILADADLQESVSVENVAVDGSAYFNGAQFTGTFEIENVRVAGRVNVGHGKRAARFRQGTKWDDTIIGQGVDFAGLRAVGTSLNLTETRIGGDVVFVDAEMGDLDLSGSQIGGRLIAERIRCSGFLKCVNVTIDQDVAITSASFALVDFYGTTIGGALQISETTIEGAPNGAESTIGALSGRFLSVKRDVRITESTISTVVFDGAEITGTTDLRGMGDTLKTLRLRGGTFASIIMMHRVPSEIDRARFAAATIDLAESTYAFVQADPIVLMDRFEKPRNRQPYLTLEQALRRRGLDAEADDVYVRMRARANLTRPSKIGDWIAYQSTGYGTSFTRVFALLAIVLVFGTVYFASVKGPVRFFGPDASGKPVGDGAKYSCTSVARPDTVEAIWLSVKSFIPTSFPDSSWNVDDDCPGAVGWGRNPLVFAPLVTIGVVALLKLVGLIFIPLLLAMLAGLFRPSARA